MLHLLYEAPEVAEPPEREPQGQGPKATKTKTKHNPFSHLDDLDAISSGNMPMARPKEPEDSEPGQGGANPELRRASASDTRARTSRIAPGDQMRDYLNRINFTAADDEIDDVTAAANRDPDPEPTTDVDFVRPADVPVILNQQLQAAGEQMPEWHTINNLPGYMARNIRSMGRQFFSMFTRTPLEQIMTIANVQGQGPNTDEELRAVGAWLRDNGEDHGQVDIDMGPAIPGYNPDVKEYSAMGLRFHVVRDPMGTYIYAYPEQDARTPGAANPRLGHNRPRLRENTMKPITTKMLAEEYTLHKAEQLACQKWTAELIESLIQESTLSRAIGGTPGGQALVRWMHDRHKVSNVADWQAQPFDQRIMWTEFKNHPDQFLIISGTRGVAGIKPNESDFAKGEASARKRGKVYDPSKDTTMRYQIVAFREDEQVDPELLRSPADVDREADPTIMKARGGLPHKRDPEVADNIFDRLREQIGSLQAIYIAKGRFTPGHGQEKEIGRGKTAGIPIATAQGGIERDKIKSRVPAPPPEFNSSQALSDMLKRVRPVLNKLGNQAIGMINNRAKKSIESGNFDEAQSLARRGKEIKNFLVSINVSQGEEIDLRYGGPVYTLLWKAIAQAAGEAGMNSSEWLRHISDQPTAKLGPMLDGIRAGRMQLGTI